MQTKQESTRLYWAPRLKKAKLARLYASDAQGLLDEELLDDVGLTLYLRCQSILDVWDARQGRVRCHGCSTVIRHQGSAMLECPNCGWKVAWETFATSHKGKQLFAGGALASFQRFVKTYPNLRTLKQKLMAIDRLIHEFHYYLNRSTGTYDVTGRTTGCNLIQGRHNDIVLFLDTLSSSNSSPEVRATHHRWKQKAHLWNRGPLP